MDDLKQQAAVAALNKMMAKGYFDICTIDSLAKLFDVVPDPDAYAILRAVHCVHYNAMPRELYANLPALIQRVLGGEPVFQFEIRKREPLALVLEGPARAGEIRELEEKPARRGWLGLLRHG